jgi:hypothetical protein
MIASHAANTEVQYVRMVVAFLPGTYRQMKIRTFAAYT